MDLVAELVAGEAAQVSFTPRVRAQSATVELRAGSGALVAGPVAATLSPVDTTITALGPTPDIVTLGSVAGVAVNGDYQLESIDGWKSVVRVAKIAGLVATFDAAPPSPPKVGDALKGLTFTATIAPGSTRGDDFRLHWRLTLPGGEVVPHIDLAAVVAARFMDPVGPDTVARMVQAIAPGQMRLLGIGQCMQIAEKANLSIRAILTKVQDYPHLVHNTRAFQEAADVAVELQLAFRSIVQNGTGDIQAARLAIAKRLEAAVRAAAAAAWNNRNGNDSIEPTERLGIHATVLERV